jgi:cellobiose-specific phosphotransferase system component IIC
MDSNSVNNNDNLHIDIPNDLSELDGTAEFEITAKKVTRFIVVGGIGMCTGGTVKMLIRNNTGSLTKFGKVQVAIGSFAIAAVVVAKVEARYRPMFDKYWDDIAEALSTLED